MVYFYIFSKKGLYVNSFQSIKCEMMMMTWDPIQRWWHMSDDSLTRAGHLFKPQTWTEIHTTWSILKTNEIYTWSLKFSFCLKFFNSVFDICWSSPQPSFASLETYSTSKLVSALGCSASSGNGCDIYLWFIKLVPPILSHHHFCFFYLFLYFFDSLRDRYQAREVGKLRSACLMVIEGLSLPLQLLTSLNWSWHSKHVTQTHHHHIHRSRRFCSSNRGWCWEEIRFESLVCHHQKLDLLSRPYERRLKDALVIRHTLHISFHQPKQNDRYQSTSNLYWVEHWWNWMKFQSIRLDLESMKETNPTLWNRDQILILWIWVQTLALPFLVFIYFCGEGGKVHDFYGTEKSDIASHLNPQVFYFFYLLNPDQELICDWCDCDEWFLNSSQSQSSSSLDQISR